MGFFSSIKNGLVDIGGALVGYAEMLGFKYKVKPYRYKVSDILWRGSRLSDNDIADLAGLRIKLVVNLCAEMHDNEELCHQVGMKTLRIPVLDNQHPSDSQVFEFLRAIGDHRSQPAYVHCEAGKGRTGIFVACYRMMIQHRTVNAAIAEAKKFGMAIPAQEEFLRDFAKRHLTPV